MSEQSAEADKSALVSRSEWPVFIRRYLDALRAADIAGAYRVASRALEGGVPLATLYQRVIAPAMHELGRLWEKGAITIADEHLATALTQRVLAAVRTPELLEETLPARPDKPRALLAAVQGEQHALGLRMAADLLEDSGYQVAYLGADVPTEALLQAVRTLSPDLLGLSATMPESARRLEDVVELVGDERPRLPLLLGGQGSGSPRLGEGIRIDDLERLSEKLPTP
ncbi:MAG TPA: cobalamin-dependent protein [Solirubrobacterales bacterium]|nr:cobalamin-dependent protein [Solirubrobacterales bacterium]